MLASGQDSRSRVLCLDRYLHLALLPSTGCGKVGVGLIAQGTRLGYTPLGESGLINSFFLGLASPYQGRGANGHSHTPTTAGNEMDNNG